METAPSLVLRPRGAGAGQDARLQAWEGRCCASIPQGEPGWDTEQQDALLLLPATQHSLQARTETLKGILGIQFTFPGAWRGDESPESLLFPLLEHNFPQQTPLLFRPAPSRAKFSWGLKVDTHCLCGAGLRDVSPGCRETGHRGASGPQHWSIIRSVLSRASAHSGDGSGSTTQHCHTAPGHPPLC